MIKIIFFFFFITILSVLSLSKYCHCYASNEHINPWRFILIAFFKYLKFILGDFYIFKFGNAVFCSLSKYYIITHLGSGALPGIMLDHRLLKIGWGNIFPISNPSGGV